MLKKNLPVSRPHECVSAQNHFLMRSRIATVSLRPRSSETRRHQHPHGQQRSITSPSPERFESEGFRSSLLLAANLIDVLYLQMLLDTSSRFGQPPTAQRISALPNILRPST